MIEASRLKQLLLFALLAVLSYGLYERYFNDSKEQKYQPFTKGYALTGVVIKSTDDDGKVVTTIQSPAITFYADSERTIIEQPHIKLHEPNGDWVFESEVGEINPNRTEIYFPNEVRVNLENSKAEAETVKINTSALTVDVTKKTGKTAELLSMAEPGMALKGVGAVVNFIHQEVEILSEMYAEFEN